jgi:hypothetical protein
MLGCVGKGLPFDQVRDLANATPSNEYTLYVLEPSERLALGNERGFDTTFILVHSVGEKETILDSGDIRGGFRLHSDSNYADVEVIGRKLGRFKFYVSVGLRLTHSY